MFKLKTGKSHGHLGARGHPQFFQSSHMTQGYIDRWVSEVDQPEVCMTCHCKQRCFDRLISMPMDSHWMLFKA